MNGIIIILLAILLSAFFSGMEIAFIASNRLRIELDRKQKVFGSGILKIFTDNPGQYIATMLIGNNVALVIYGLVFSDIFAPVLGSIIHSEFLLLLASTIVSTLIILFVAEFFPKTIFIISPNFFLKLLSIPTLIFFFLFYPVSKFSLAASNLCIRLFFRGTSPSKKDEEIVFGRVDLDHLVSTSQPESEKGDDDHNIKIFRNALDFSNIRLRELMVPRTEIEAIEATSSIDELRNKFIATRYSRILVYQDTIDNVTGYVELKDIFVNPPEINSVIRKITIVPETMNANKLLHLFAEKKKYIAVVVDEFGGTSGMVTIEDILEEIVGDIEDEHDKKELIEKVKENGEYILSGRLEIDYLNEKYKLNLPEADEYETLAGLILFHHARIPAGNEIIKIKNFTIRILRSSNTRIELLSLKTE